VTFFPIISLHLIKGVMSALIFSSRISSFSLKGIEMKNISAFVLGFLVFAVTNAWASGPTGSTVVNGQEILTSTVNGLTAYTFDPDQPDLSNCYDGCAKAWPPILLPAGETVAAPLGVTTRKDGTEQITYDGHPIYNFANDHQAGDTKGDGLGGVWHLVAL
jgi:predicted lipoprotein with Yx(FWY)xxD motif